MAALAAACLAVAAGWKAWLVVADVRHVRAAHPDARAYRPELGWTSHALLTLRLRWACVGVVTTGALAVSVVVPSSAEVLWPAAGTATAVWIVRDTRLDYGRYTSVCIATLAMCVALAGIGPAAAGLIASVAAAQMYLVAAIRKLRAPDFMRGRVVLDNVAYAACQAAAGNRQFLRIVSPTRIADLLERGTLMRGCRAAATATAAAEIAVGVGAMGLLPVAATFAIAAPMHLGFTLLSPYRLVTFTSASLGMLALASIHPILDPGFGG